MQLEAPVIRKTLPAELPAGSATRLAGLPPVLGGDALHDHLDVVRRGAARLGERVRQRLDDLRHRFLGDAGVVELHVDPGHWWSFLLSLKNNNKKESPTQGGEPTRRPLG